MLNLSNLNDFKFNQIGTHSSLDCMEYNKMIDLSYIEESKKLNIPIVKIFAAAEHVWTMVFLPDGKVNILDNI